MKVVLDTNVIISGLLWKGRVAAFFDLADREKIKVCLTPKILEEIIRVLGYPKIKKQLDSIKTSVNEIVVYLFYISEIYPDPPIEIDLPDPSDKIFVGAALISQAQYLITGDKHLLALRHFDGIQILRPKEFLTRYYQ